MNRERYFGAHLMCEGYDGNEKKLNDKEEVYYFLDKLPRRLGMRKLAKPVVYWADPNGKKDCGGWSGFVVIAESHISVHTFPKLGFATFDVYTCRTRISRKKVLDYLTYMFDFKDYEVNYQKRGFKFPFDRL